ncbi:hypothetical protein DDZ14_05560 [Maritimibacter sp. 55A14]|uniref:energy transducer TonB family protein n=1 Tax=Maritimibacter sp. 55A14 TaxID=2174844 RepID=UPI000D60912E|nr:energy transducer TonB [Maritimibacter sp. 55A14]PWE33257.1 hypothetical protein DDZ14_05560 [Maritimibacter sp. 55A14]
MRQALEMLGFLSLAAGLHVAIFAVNAPDPGASRQGAGAGGQASASLGAAPPDVARAVSEWARPPEVAERVDHAAAPVPDRLPETLPRADRVAVLSRDAPVPDTPRPPRADPPVPPARAPLPLLPDTPTQGPQPEAAVAPDIPEQRAPPEPAARRAPDPAVVQPPEPAPAPPEPPVDLRHADADTLRPRARPDASEAASQPAAAAPQRAAGKGRGQTAATPAPAAEPGLTSGARRTLIAEWGGQIRARIERSKRQVRGMSGRVVVELVVARDGGLRAVRVVQGSGDPRLDGVALDAVRRAGPFPPAPDGLPGAAHPFRLPIRFAR